MEAPPKPSGSTRIPCVTANPHCTTFTTPRSQRYGHDAMKGLILSCHCHHRRFSRPLLARPSSGLNDLTASKVHIMTTKGPSMLPKMLLRPRNNGNSTQNVSINRPESGLGTYPHEARAWRELGVIGLTFHPFNPNCM